MPIVSPHEFVISAMSLFRFFFFWFHYLVHDFLCSPVPLSFILCAFQVVRDLVHFTYDTLLLSGDSDCNICKLMHSPQQVVVTVYHVRCSFRDQNLMSCHFRDQNVPLSVLRCRGLLFLEWGRFCFVKNCIVNGLHSAEPG